MNEDLKQGIWTILGFLIMMALLIPAAVVYDQWRRAHPRGPKPQIGRYEVVATGAETVVKLDTATGKAWTLRDLGDVHKWSSVAEDTDVVYQRDSKGKLVPVP